MIEILAPPRVGGTVYPLNPYYEAGSDELGYPSLRELPETVDLAFVAVADSRYSVSPSRKYEILENSIFRSLV